MYPLARLGCFGEVLLRERLGFGRRHHGFEPLHVDVAVAGDADRQRLDGAVGMLEIDDEVLQRVGGGPVAVGVASRVVGVDEVDERLDRRGAGRVVDDCVRKSVERDLVGHRRGDGLDVGGVVARRAADVGVLADVHRCEELLRLRAAHRTRHRRHDHVRQPHPLEQRDVGGAVRGVRLVESCVGEVEAVGVLHDELARAQQSGTGAGLVAVLGLDLVEAGPAGPCRSRRGPSPSA